MASEDKKLSSGDVLPDHDYSTVGGGGIEKIEPNDDTSPKGMPNEDIRMLIDGVVDDVSKEQLPVAATEVVAPVSQERTTRRKKSNNPKHINVIQIKDKPVIVKQEYIVQKVKSDPDGFEQEVVIEVPSSEQPSSKRIRKPNPRYSDTEMFIKIERAPTSPKARKSPTKKRRRMSAAAAVSSEEEEEEEDEKEEEEEEDEQDAEENEENNEEDGEIEDDDRSAEEEENVDEDVEASSSAEEEEPQPQPKKSPARRGRKKAQKNQPHMKIVEKFMKMKDRSKGEHTVRIYFAGEQMMVTEKDLEGNVMTYQYSPSYQGRRNLGNQGSFICGICQIDFALKENLENHLMNEHGTSVHDEGMSAETSAVDDTTLDYDTLVSMIDQPDVLVSYQCDNCQSNFADLKRLERHSMRNDCKVAENRGGNLACPTCGKLFRYKSLLKLHHYTHTGEKPFKCDYCDQKFAQPGNLNKHLRTTHNEPPKRFPSTMKCKGCRHLFSTDENYEAHLSPVGKSCRFCYKILPNNCKLSQHMKKNHPESGGKKNGGFVCNHCSRCFDYQAQLTVHERVHTGTKPFICDICEKGFSQKGNLNVHMKMHFPKEMQAEKRFQCQYCSKMFPHRPHLEVHLRIHQGIKPFRCDVCGKAFSQRGNLNVHHKIHTGEKNYACKECGKSFAYRPQLLVHSRIHTGARPYVCKICQKQFSQAGNLNVHIRAVHNADKSVVVRRRPKIKKLQPPNMIHSYETSASDEEDSEDDEEEDMEDAEAIEAVRREYQIVPAGEREVVEIDQQPQAIPQEYEVVTSPTETVIEATTTASGVTVVTDADGNEYQLMTDQNMKVFQLQNVSGSLQLVTTDPKNMDSLPVYISNSDEVPSGTVYEVVVSS